MDKIVFDIETKNFFNDPGVGRDNFDALNISVVGAYSYEKDAYFCFEEDQISEMNELFGGAQTIIGFSSNRYDIPVLNRYLTCDLWQKERVDLLEEIEVGIGRRVSLESLAKANLGRGKSGHGSHAITLYNEGRISELKSYCLDDVKITKELYDIARKTGALMVFDRNTEEYTPVAVQFV